MVHAEHTKYEQLNSVMLLLIMGEVQPWFTAEEQNIMM
jgi:hypothetical protein